MKILSQEVVVEHNGNTFRRVYDHTTEKLSWQLYQSTDEFELWTTIHDGVDALSKAYAEHIHTQPIA